MKEKRGQLKNDKIYINHDLSREDRNGQRKLGEIARQEREHGAEVMLKFRKIKINGNWIKWEQRMETMVFYGEESKEVSK